MRMSNPTDKTNDIHDLTPVVLFHSSPSFASPPRQLDGLVVTWKRDGRQLSTGRRFVVPAASSSDSGLYVCEASHSSGSAALPVEAKAQLTVIGEETDKGNKMHTNST